MSIVVNFYFAIPAARDEQIVEIVVYQECNSIFVFGVVLNNQAWKQIQTYDLTIYASDKAPSITFIYLNYCYFWVHDVAVTFLFKSCFYRPNLQAPQRPNINL